MFGFRTLYDPLTNELVNTTSELLIYLIRHFVFELIVPLIVFVPVMLIFFVDWTWIPISANNRSRAISLEALKNQLFK